MKRNLPPERSALLAMPRDAGLCAEEVSALRLRFGANVIAEQPRRTWRTIARDATGDAMLWFLLATSALFGVTGQYTDMGILLAAIFPLLGMDVYLHHRVQVSTEGLTSVLATDAKVFRDAVESLIPSDEVVAGDLVTVSAGDAFPADGIILTGEELQADESSLTGEAYPVAKSPWSTDGADLEQIWGFAGTRLLTGEARIRIIFTGQETVYGEIVQSVLEGSQGRTPLQNAVTQLVKVLLVASALFCVLLACVRLYQGFGVVDALLSAATLAVAAIPEEFPVVLTFFLGVGVYRLAKVRALVRRAVAVENIGRISAICTDKTGTITEGRLAFSDALPASNVDPDWLLTVARLASRADSGDPLDKAILTHAPPLNDRWERVRVHPFTEARRRESALWRRPEGTLMLAVKGAPETVLALCVAEDAERARWLEIVRKRSSSGEKLIACACQPVSHDRETDLDDGYRFAGLIAVIDPVRPGVRGAVSEARSAGIKIVMVTGDHPDTAAAIARAAGIAENARVVLGDELERRLADPTDPSDARLSDIHVVARATPAQKVILVEAMKRRGHIVALTGDGVNDAPALRAADVGIAMGLRGTRAAREVSAIVLLDDNFRTIVTAIAEGRQLFRNLRMSFAFLLIVHIPLVVTAALIPLLGYPILYLPVHVVWLELLIHPSAILGFQQAATGKLRNGECARSGFFSRREWCVVGATGVAITIMLLAQYAFAIASREPADHARSLTVVSLVTSLAIALVILTRARSRAAHTIALCAIATTVGLSQNRFLAGLMHMHPLDAREWMIAALTGAVPALGALFLSTTRGQGTLAKQDGHVRRRLL